MNIKSSHHHQLEADSIWACSRRHTYLDVEDALGLEAGVVEVEVLVAAAERGAVARVVEEARDLAAQALPVAAPGEHGLREVRLPLHELLGLLRVRVLQPARPKRHSQTTKPRNLNPGGFEAILLVLQLTSGRGRGSGRRGRSRRRSRRGGRAGRRGGRRRRRRSPWRRRRRA